MQIENMHPIKQINHHATLYDRIRQQTKHTPADAMAMKQHAAAIIGVVDQLAVEAEALRQKMMQELGVYEIATT